MLLSMLVAIPVIVIWVIACPLLMFLYLFKNRDKLEKPEFYSKYKAIYRGLKPKYFFWEFVNILRKCFLVSINVFLQTEVDIFKAMVVLLVLNVLLRIQGMIQPYKSDLINILERREIVASIFTYFGALLYVQSEISD